MIVTFLGRYLRSDAGIHPFRGRLRMGDQVLEKPVLLPKCSLARPVLRLVQGCCGILPGLSTAIEEYIVCGVLTVTHVTHGTSQLHHASLI